MQHPVLEQRERDSEHARVQPEPRYSELDYRVEISLDEEASDFDWALLSSFVFGSEP